MCWLPSGRAPGSAGTAAAPSPATARRGFEGRVRVLKERVGDGRWESVTVGCTGVYCIIMKKECRKVPSALRVHTGVSEVSTLQRVGLKKRQDQVNRGHTSPAWEFCCCCCCRGSRGDPSELPVQEERRPCPGLPSRWLAFLPDGIRARRSKARRGLPASGDDCQPQPRCTAEFSDVCACGDLTGAYSPNAASLLNGQPITSPVPTAVMRGIAAGLRPKCGFVPSHLPQPTTYMPPGTPALVNTPYPSVVQRQIQDAIGQAPAMNSLVLANVPYRIPAQPQMHLALVGGPPTFLEMYRSLNGRGVEPWRRRGRKSAYGGKRPKRLSAEASSRTAGEEGGGVALNVEG